MRKHLSPCEAQARIDLYEGSVSVEFALGIVAVMSVLAMILAGIDAAHAQGQACQLAREGARSATRTGGSDAESLMTLPLPAGYEQGSVSTAHEGQWVRARARWPLHSPVAWLAPEMTCEILTLREEPASW